METVLGVDIGGSKVAAGVVTSDGRLLRRAAAPTTVGTDPERLMTTLLAVIAEVRAGDEVACGVGCGGPMTPGGDEVSPLNIPAWRSYPLRRRLTEALAVPVHIDNDAKALALAEGWVGAARGVRNFIAMVVSTGVGGGIVVDGHLLDGAGGNAGHIGHVIVEPEGRICACGAQGCLEAEASGTGIATRIGSPAQDAPIEERLRAGRLVGQAVASVANLLDLRLAVVAGSVALGFGDTFFQAAQSELDRLARLTFSAGARIMPAALGDEGPLIGAAAVAWRALGTDLGIA